MKYDEWKHAVKSQHRMSRKFDVESEKVLEFVSKVTK